MRTRLLSPLALFCAVALDWSAPAISVAQPAPPVERTVVTTDGAMYRGEVVEYVMGDHITLRLDTGEVRRIPFADAAQISPPRAKTPVAAPSAGMPAAPATAVPQAAGNTGQPPRMANPSATSGAGSANIAVGAVAPPPVTLGPGELPMRTVVTRDGLVYFGEVVGWDVGAFITIKLATGERRKISWAEAKKMSPMRSSKDKSDDLGSPERTIHLRDGSTVKGELVESLITDHTTLRLADGQLRVVPWKEAKRIMGPRPMSVQTIPVKGELGIVLSTGEKLQAEYFQYTEDEQLIVRLVTGGYRSIAIGQIKKIVLLGEGG